MVRKVSIAGFGDAVGELAKGKSSWNASAFIGIALWMFVCIDGLLSVKGAGLPSLSGSLLLRGYQASVSGALEAGDEAARLTLYGKPYTGWVFWAVLGTQLAAMLLGGLFLLASKPERWASEWLRPPSTPNARLAVSIVCVAAAAAAVWAGFTLWKDILVVNDAAEAASVGSGPVSVSTATMFALAVFIVGAAVPAGLLPSRMPHLRFIWWSVAVSLVIAVLGVMASRLLLLGERPFRITDRPFDVFRALEALFTVPLVAALLLWLSFKRFGRLVCVTFEIVPSPEDRQRMNVTHDQSLRSGLPRFFVRMPKETSADFCGFLVLDEHPRTIAAPLEYNESIEFTNGRLGFLHLAKSTSFSIALNVVPYTGRFQLSGSLAVTVSDTRIQSSRGVRMPAAGGRECFDWELIQRIFRSLGGVDQTFTQPAVTNLIRDILRTEAGEVLRNVSDAPANAAVARANAATSGLEAAMAAAVPTPGAAGQASAAPTMYGPSPAGAAIALAQVTALQQAMTSLITDCRTTRERIESQVSRIQSEFETRFFDHLVADQERRDLAMSSVPNLGPEDVGKRLLHATTEALRRMIQIQGSLTTNVETVLEQVSLAAQSLLAEITAATSVVHANAISSSDQYQKMINEGALERIKQQAAKLAAVMQALSTPSGFQASTVEEFREHISAVVREASGAPPRTERPAQTAASEQAKDSEAWR